MSVQLTVQIVLILLLTLLGLFVVIVARRDASETRAAAKREAADMADEARMLMSEAQRREERVALREQRAADDQRNAGEYLRGIEARVSKVARDEKRLASERDAFLAERISKLEDIAGMTAEEARTELVARVTAQAESDVDAAIARAERAALTDSDERAKRALVAAMQRLAAPVSSQASVTVVPLPSDEMRGRLIGREGRNIRTFEAVTGVNLIIDEGASDVVLSSFDVERREIAEVALRDLMADGRVQPRRIEEACADARERAPERSRAAGMEAADDAGITGLTRPIIDRLGALRLRTSYTQNVLAHLVECANLARDIAEQVGANPEVAARAAFLHDIGKAFAGERQGGHAAVGAEFLAEQGESSAVVHAVAAHHDEIPVASLEAVIVQVADTLSASRPGARHEDESKLVERLAELERVVRSIEGVLDVAVFAAGREVRVVASPDTVDDSGVERLARTIAQRIDTEPAVAGEVKVTVIREMRADAVAGRE